MSPTVTTERPAPTGAPQVLPAGTSTAQAPARPARPFPVDARTVLAASGFVMLGFVALHLGGNLLALAGGAAFNAYARGLRELGAPLVGPGVVVNVARIVLAGALVAHLGAHARILLTGDASPTPAWGSAATAAAPYLPAPPRYAAYPLPVLLASGGALALFLVLHLAQLTFGVLGGGFDPADPYGNTVRALRSWPVSLAYLAAAAAVGVHLLTGVWTGMRSLGLIRPRTERLARVLAPATALAATLGLAAVPAAVFVGALA